MAPHTQRMCCVCAWGGVMRGHVAARKRGFCACLAFWALVSSGFNLGSVGRHSCGMMNVEWLAKIVFRGMCTVVFAFLFSAVLQQQKQRAAGRAGTGQRLCLLLFSHPPSLLCTHCSVEHPCMGCELMCDRRSTCQRGRGCLSPGTHRFSWLWFSVRRIACRHAPVTACAWPHCGRRGMHVH